MQRRAGRHCRCGTCCARVASVVTAIGVAAVVINATIVADDTFLPSVLISGRLIDTLFALGRTSRKSSVLFLRGGGGGADFGVFELKLLGALEAGWARGCRRRRNLPRCRCRRARASSHGPCLCKGRAQARRAKKAFYLATFFITGLGHTDTGVP